MVFCGPKLRPWWQMALLWGREILTVGKEPALPGHTIKSLWALAITLGALPGMTRIHWPFLFPLRIFPCLPSETLFPVPVPMPPFSLARNLFFLMEMRIRKSEESGRGKGLKLTLSMSSTPTWLVRKQLRRILLWGRGAIIKSFLFQAWW